MSTNHFNYFRVKNFKRFKDLEVKDIGQFNLVLGDNNVGKTSLLEALMYDKEYDNYIQSLSKRLFKRNIGDRLTGGVWEFYVNKDSLIQNSSCDVRFEIGSNLSDTRVVDLYRFKKNNKEVLFWSGIAELFTGHIDGDSVRHNPSSFQWFEDYFEPLISNMDKHEFDLTRQYSKLIQYSPRQIKANFIEALQIIDSSIRGIEIENISTDQPLITIESDQFLGRNLLASYGDGLIVIFRILLFLSLFRDKKLMIDEIDAGIHYSRMKDYWKVILKSAKENNVQIFATTHNQECIQYCIEALEELGGEYKEQARAIRMVEHAQTREIISFTRTIDEITEDFVVGNELR